MLSEEKKQMMCMAQGHDITTLRNLSGTQLDYITEGDIDQIDLFDRRGDGVWQLTLEYNGMTLRYALAHEDGEWYSTMATARLRPLLSNYVKGIPLPCVDVVVQPEEFKQPRKYLDMLIALLWNIPYPIKLQSGTNVYTIRATDESLVIASLTSERNIVAVGNFVMSEYDINQLLIAVLNLVPVRYYFKGSSLLPVDVERRCTVTKRLGDTILYRFGDASIIYKENSFVVSCIDLDNYMSTEDKELVELLDLYCALHKDVEFSRSITELLVKLNVREDAVELLKKLTDTMGG